MRIRTAITTAALAVGVLATSALPASAAGQLCYDLHADVNGTVVAQADCVETP